MSPKSGEFFFLVCFGPVILELNSVPNDDL